MLTACISLLLLALWALNRNLTPLQLSSRTEQNNNGDEDEFASLRDEVRQRDVTLHAVLDSINLGIVAIDTEGKFTCFNHWTREIFSRGAIADLKPFRWPENYPMRYALENSPVAADDYPLLRAMQEEFASDWESLSSETGTITVRLLLENELQGLEITDTGLGIDQETYRSYSLMVTQLENPDTDSVFTAARTLPRK